MTTHLHTLATILNKTNICYKTYMFLMDVADFWATFSDHTFLSIFVVYSSALLHFRWRLTPRNHVNSRFTSDAHEKYKSSHWKCTMLVIGRFTIGNLAFHWFPEMYFRFPRHHVDISGRYVTELYMPINSPVRRFKHDARWPIVAVIHVLHTTPLGGR